MRAIFPSFRLLALCLLLVSFKAFGQDGQDSPAPLGDLARNLRKNKSEQTAQQQADPNRPVIDNDNLSQVMNDAKNARPVKQDKTVFSIDPSSNTLKMSAPDVTCSLSFNSKTSALLIRPVLIEDLPLTELLKIDGPGSIEDAMLQLQVFNGTDWDVREITVGLTLERKPGENAEIAARARVLPAADGIAAPSIERRSDVTLLYHLKAEAKPFTTTAFHESIGMTPGPDEDWRWSIVDAKGIRPSQTLAAPESLQEPLFSNPLTPVPKSNDAPPASMAPESTSSDKDPNTNPQP
jgi:hypothetical protein